MSAFYKRVPVVAKNRCTVCGVCAAACPHECLGVDGGHGALVQPDTCTSEGRCVSACPQGAIRMRWLCVDGDRSVGQWRARATALRP